MTNSNSYHLAMSAFHSAIDCEQANKNEEAYEKYVEGLALVSTILKNEVNCLHLPNVVKKHKHMVEFAKRSADRLLKILQKLESERERNGYSPDEPSTYQILSETLPEIRTNTPMIPVSFKDEMNDVYSPLSALEEDKQRIRRNYEKIIDSLMDVKAKANLRLELERRLAENDALARKKYAQWEEGRKTLAAECRKIAEQKFFIQDRIRSGEANDSDYTKQNLYAQCLQYHKEHAWAQEASCKLLAESENGDNVKKLISLILQHKSHPIACMLRQIQQKVLNKLSKIYLPQTRMNKNERTVLEEHFKSIVNDIKEDLFTITTVIQAIWECLASETNHSIVLDVLHHFYFPGVKPYLIQILRVLLIDQEEQLQKCMAKNSERATPYPSNLNPIISRLYQLSFMHSPTAMMSSLVEVLRTFVNTCYNKNSPDETLLSISIDDVMPKLIQLILISNMSTLIVEITFVENFIPAKKALGEEGYAVTLIQSILSYIYTNGTTFDSNAF